MAAIHAIMFAVFALNEARPQFENDVWDPPAIEENLGQLGTKLQEQEQGQGPLPDSAVLKTLVRYDKGFLEFFAGNKSATEIALKMLIQKTKENLALLPVKVILEVTSYEYYPETIQPEGESVKFLYSQHKTEGRKGHVSYFVDRGSAEPAGMAAGGCGLPVGWFNINGCYGNCVITNVNGIVNGMSDIHSHEVGHNLGMAHTKDGGFMGGKPGSWSETSRQQFKAWMSKYGSNCLTEN